MSQRVHNLAIWFLNTDKEMISGKILKCKIACKENRISTAAVSDKSILGSRKEMKNDSETLTHGLSSDTKQWILAEQ